MESETFLQAVAQGKSSIQIVGLNEKDLSKTIKITKSNILNQANNYQNRHQCKLLKLRGAETGFISHVDSFCSSVSRKGFLLRLAHVDHITSLCIWLEAYGSNFNGELARLASDDVTHLSIKLIKPHGRCWLVKIFDGVTLNFPRLKKLEIYWEYDSNQCNNIQQHLLHENFKKQPITGKFSMHPSTLKLLFTSTVLNMHLVIYSLFILPLYLIID